MEGSVSHVRVPRGEVRRPRNLPEKLISRMPGLVEGILAGIERLPAGSAVRRSLIVRASTMGWAAASRGDFDLLLLTYDPDAVYSTEMPPELRLPDAPTGGSFRGKEAIRDYVARFHGSWGEMYLEPSDVLVLEESDRVLVLGTAYLRGLASGIEVETPLANVIDLKGGRIIRQADYWNHQEAFQAAELDPGDYPEAGGGVSVK